MAGASAATSLATVRRFRLSRRAISRWETPSAASSFAAAQLRFLPAAFAIAVRPSLGERLLGSSRPGGSAPAPSLAVERPLQLGAALALRLQRRASLGRRPRLVGERGPGGLELGGELGLDALPRVALAGAAVAERCTTPGTE